MTEVGVGTVRQIWLAKMADPSTKYQFLIRDDTYSKSGAQFGRSIRLGDPVNLGPNSTWTQTSWEGGEDQEIWDDMQMFKEGSADMNSKTGKIRMWSGWEALFYDGARNKHDQYLMCRGTTGAGFTGPLYIAESDTFCALGGAALSYKVYRYLPATGVFADTGVAANNGRSLVAFLDDSTVNKAVMLTTAPTRHTGAETGGRADFIFETPGTLPLATAQETTTGVPVSEYYPNGIGFHDRDIYFLAGSQIAKFRYNFLAPATWTNLGNILTCNRMCGIVNWNSRMWFGVVTGGSRTAIYVTDGITFSKAFEVPDEFEIMALHVHFGALYMAGYRVSGDGTSVIGVIYRYTGTTLTTLYEEGDGKDGRNHAIYSLCSFGPNLCWGRPATPLTGMRAGVKMWNAETDSIFDGPTIEIDPQFTEGVLVPNVIAHNSTLVACFFNKHSYGGSHTNPKLIARVRASDLVRNKGLTQSFAWQAMVGTTKSQYVLSSIYAGTADIEAENKTWLNARIRVRLPDSSTRVIVSVILNENGTVIPIGTIVGDSLLPDWRAVDLPITSGGLFLQSRSIQYKLEVANTEASNVDTTKNAEVDTCTIQYRIAPTLRRQWEVRIHAQDAQRQLPTNAAGFNATGAANTLTTADAQFSKLEEFWSEGKPVLLWEPSVYGDTPVGSGIPVNVSAFAANGYRVETSSGVVQQEVALTLVENT